jgi:drug/metabolite transporter (DMT)-like permease
MSHQKPDLRSVLSLIAAAACWGAATVITKSVLSFVPPITLLVFQLAFSLALLLAFAYFSHKRFSITKNLWKIGLLGLLNPGISYSLSLVGLTTATASMSTLLWACEPILIIGLSTIILREHLSPRVFILSVFAFLGVVWVSGIATSTWSTPGTSGSLLILGGVLCCALYTVLFRHFDSDTDPLIAITLQQAFAFVWALLIWPLEFDTDTTNNILNMTVANWFWIGLSGATYYAFAFWFYLRGLARVNASVAGAMINLIPIFGICGAYIFLGERLLLMQWVGAAAILISVFAILLWPDRQASSQINEAR